MKKIDICLPTTEDVKKFVSIVSKQPFDVDVKSGRYCVDGKSMLGMFALNHSKPISVEIHSDNCDALLKELKIFAENITKTGL